MIPCYSEPTEIVEMTLRACYDMDYPAHKLTCWVCDDGKKDDMRDMVAQVSLESPGIATRYVARIKTPGVPHHAKAGNLNNCIFNTDSCGQLIIVLDCDMLPGEREAHRELLCMCAHLYGASCQPHAVLCTVSCW